MELTESDLKAPTGELEEFMFPVDPAKPDLTFDARVTAWLAEATLKVASLDGDKQDDAARAWVYHRGFKAFLLRVTATPAKATLDSGKTELEYTSEQIKTWKNLPDFYLSQFQSYFATSSVGVAVKAIVSPIPKGTMFS